MFLHNPFPGAFGLDIGDLSIKLVQLEKIKHFRKESSFVLKEMRSISLPPGYIVDGELQQPEMVRKKLLHILGKDGKQKPIKSTWVVANLPETKSFLKLIKINIPTSELVYDDVKYHIKKHILYDLKEMYLDWQVVNDENDGKKFSMVLVAGMPKIITDAYNYLLESVGLTPIILEIEAASIARSMVTSYKDYKGEARAILNLGATRSNLIIYDKKSLQFTNELKFSGELFTTAIAQKLNISHEEAENLKIKNGFNKDSKYPGYLKEVVTQADKLVEEIKESIGFYSSHFKDTNPINHITLCGGMARTKKITEYLSKKLNIETAPGHPWKNLISKNFAEEDNRTALSFSSAIGLALKAAENILE